MQAVAAFSALLAAGHDAGLMVESHTCRWLESRGEVQGAVAYPRMSGDGNAAPGAADRDGAAPLPGPPAAGTLDGPVAAAGFERGGCAVARQARVLLLPRP